MIAAFLSVCVVFLLMLLFMMINLTLLCFPHLAVNPHLVSDAFVEIDFQFVEFLVLLLRSFVNRSLYLLFFHQI
jgi:hypothetical protein